MTSPALALAEALQPSGARVEILGTTDMPDGSEVQHALVRLPDGKTLGIDVRYEEGDGE